VKRVTLDEAIAIVERAVGSRAGDAAARAALALIVREAKRPKRRVIAVPFPEEPKS
jgi:hypothetical protein